MQPREINFVPDTHPAQVITPLLLILRVVAPGTPLDSHCYNYLRWPRIELPCATNTPFRIERDLASHRYTYPLHPCIELHFLVTLCFLLLPLVPEEIIHYVCSN